MLTSHILNQHNVLADFSRQQSQRNKSKLTDKQIEKIVNDQDVVVNRFVTTLDNNIQNYLIANIGKPHLNLFLPIKNALWQLWNESWFLGQLHARDELKVKFNSNSRLVTFAKDNDKKQTRVNRAKEVVNKETQRTTTKQRTNKQQDKVRSYPSNEKINKAYEQVEQLRQQQENTKPPQLENTQFGKSYLDKRFTEISNSLNQQYVTSYSERLKEVIPDYFSDTRSDKDKSYVNKIRRMYINDVQQNNKYKEQELKITSLIKYQQQQQKENANNEVDKLKKDVVKKDAEIVDLKLQLKRTTNPKRQSELKIQIIKSTNEENLLQKQLTDNENKLSLITNALSDPKAKEQVFISISDNDRRELGLTKQQYSVRELEQIRATVRKNIREQDQNYYNTKRIALTELNAAYNLGRLDYYQNNNINYVKWEVSVEHKRRKLNKSNSSDAGTIRSYNSKHYSTNSYKGSVCPVCWERNGRVYPISEVVQSAELQIPVHPFCGCILVPVKDDDDDAKNRKKVKGKVSDLFNNSVMKWAAGAGVIALGTAALYAAFRMTRRNPIQPPLIEQIPTVKKLLPKTIKAPDYVKETAATVADIIEENKEQLLQQVQERQSNIDKVEQGAALPELQPKQKPIFLPEPLVVLDVIPLGIPNRTIDVQPYNNEINKSINTVVDNVGTTYEQHTDSLLEEVVRNKREFNAITPTHTSNTITKEVDDIRNRLSKYQSYLRNDLTKNERNAVIQQYRKDLTKLNEVIDDYESNNFQLYAEIRTLTKLRDEGEQLIARNLSQTTTDNAKLVFASSDIGRKINNELIELDHLLRTRINSLDSGGFVDKLRELKQQLVTSNSDLTFDYLNSIKRNLINSANNLPTIAIQPIEDSLNNLTKLLQQVDKLDNTQFFQYSDALDEIADIVNSVDRRITKTILDVDLQTVVNNVPLGSSSNNDVLGTAQFLLDYKDAVRQIYNRINSLNVMLILKFNN